jgi:hypothetical protein
MRRDLQTGQVGEPAHGMQVEAVVVSPPACADLLAAVDDQRIDPGTAEGGGSCEAGGAGADHDHIVVLV